MEFVPFLVSGVIMTFIICVTVYNIMTDRTRLETRMEIRLKELEAEAKRPRLVMEDSLPGMWRVETKTEPLDKKP